MSLLSGRGEIIGMWVEKMGDVYFLWGGKESGLKQTCRHLVRLAVSVDFL